jgi:uncharacterized protein YbjQ (UPF0145 family)
MPWWRFWRPDTEEELQSAAQAEALMEQRKRAIEALTNGDIPAIAKERILKHSGRTDKFFTSDLSVNEFLLMKESGVEVISQVMGTCYYNLGFFASLGAGRYTGEMTQLTEAQSHSRLLAMQRMQQEAKLLGASGVVGVRLKVKRPDVGNRNTEFTAFGTAVRIAGYPVGAEPFISNLSGAGVLEAAHCRLSPRRSGNGLLLLLRLHRLSNAQTANGIFLYCTESGNRELHAKFL